MDKYKIIVNCEYNDPVDIRCGGPKYLGYDFLVLENEVEEIIDFIKKILEENKQPLLNIHSEKIQSNASLWTKEKICECIKLGY